MNKSTSPSNPLHIETATDTPLVWFSLLRPHGSSTDAIGSEGLCRHAVELGRRGAGDLSRTDIDTRLDDLGASLNPTVARDFSGYSGVCLETELDDVVELACTILEAPHLTGGELDKLLRETSHALDDIRDDDRMLARRFFDRHVYPGHPYARTSLGTRESLKTLTEAQVKHGWQDWMRAPMCFGFGGCIEPERAEALSLRLGLAFEAWKPRDSSVLPKPPTSRRLIVVDKPERTQSQILLGHPCAPYGHPDTAALSVAETAFGGMFTSRLMQEIRAKRGWSYGAGCRIGRGRLPHWISMSLAPASHQAGDAMALVLDMYDDLATHGITEDERQLAVNYIVGSRPFARATAHQRLHLKLEHELLGLPQGYDVTLTDEIAKVSLDAINAATARWLTPEALTAVIVATADELDPRIPAAFDDVQVVPYDSY